MSEGLRVVIDAPRRLRVAGVDLTEPGSGEVVLRTLSVGICGSDLHVLAGHHPFVSYPVYPGHEVVARVESTGEDVDSSLLGARVVLEPSLPCGTCDLCSSGRYNICESLQVMGFQAPGGMGDEFIAPVARLHRLPDDMDADAAVLVEPTAVAVHALRLGGAENGARLAVVGGGTIGLLCAQVAQASGCQVTVSDIDPRRLEVAASLGLDTRESLPHRSFDLSIECVGNEGALRAATAAARKGGTVLLAGVFGDEPRFQAGLIQDFELTLQGILMYTDEDYRRAISLLEQGAISTSSMVSARFPLAEVEEAFALAGRGGEVLKVVLEP